MGKVILLTGAPASGKSTLRRNLSEHFNGIISLDYGQLVLNRKSRDGIQLQYDQLRRQSSEVVAPADVQDLDEEVICEVAKSREDADVLIDSHAVTREQYGFRVIPFSLDQLRRLKLDAVLILRCDPEIIANRISTKPDGRIDVTNELAREHQLLQEGIGLTYSVASGCPAFVVDTPNLNEKEVAEVATRILLKIGVGEKN